MNVIANGGRTLLVDCTNGSVKALDLTAGTVSSLYKAPDGWWVGNACVVTHTDGTQSLLVTEMDISDMYTKRVVFADCEGATRIFTRTYDITWKDDNNVRVWMGRMSHHPPPTRPHPPLSALISSLDTPA